MAGRKFYSRAFVVWGGTDFKVISGYVSPGSSGFHVLYESEELNKWVIVQNAITPFKVYLDGEEAHQEHMAYDANQVWTSNSHTLFHWTPDSGTPQFIVQSFQGRSTMPVSTLGHIERQYKFTFTYTPFGQSAPVTMTSATPGSYTDEALLPRFTLSRPGTYAFQGVDKPADSLAVEVKYGNIWIKASGSGPLGTYTSPYDPDSTITLNHKKTSKEYVAGNVGVIQ